MFKKGEIVIKVIDIMGTKTATIQKVEAVKQGKVSLIGSSLQFNSVGEEIDAVLPGCRSYLVHLDGGEDERLQGLVFEDGNG